MVRELLDNTYPSFIDSVIDNTSIKDSMLSSNNVDAKRLRIDVALVKQCVEKGEIRSVTYVPDAEIISDSLTKRGAC